MKKEKNQKLPLNEAIAKRDALVKELAKYRMTLDLSAFTAQGGPVGVEREIKALNRLIATAK